MSVKTSRVFLAAALLLSFAASLGAASAKPSFTYLGRLAPGYTERVVVRDLESAGVQVVDASGGWILFRLTERTLPLPWVIDLPFLDRILADPADVRREAALRGTFLAAEFGSRPSGQTGTMRALDAQYRAAARSRAAERPRPSADLSPETSLAPIGGQLQGTVTQDGTTTGIAAKVKVLSLGNILVTSVDTSDGSYSVYLPAGTYKLLFEGGAGTDYIAEYYDGKTSFSGADSISITVGVTTTANASLALGGRISGRVTAAVGGAGLASTVYLWLATSPYSGFGGTASAADGTYVIHGIPPGEYVLKASADLNYAAEYYNDKASAGLADHVAVAVGSPATNIDFALAAGATISGVVTDASSGLSIENAQVSVFAGTQAVELAYTWTDSSGAYSISRLAAPSARVGFYGPGDYLNEYYDNKRSLDTADLVTVTAGANIPGIDAQLSVAGTISGTVRGPNGLPLEGVVCSLYDMGGTFAYGITTDSDGWYEIEQLVPGTSYKLYFDASSLSNLRSEWYDERSDFASAQTITVVSGALTIDEDLGPAGPTITVTSPASGADWYLGTRPAITWTSSGLAPSASIKILLFKGAVKLGTLFYGLADDGSEPWRIPSTLAPGDDYLIRVRTGDGSVGGDSPRFTIARPVIGVFYPPAGSSWSIGGPVKFGWDSKGTACRYVKIELFRGTTLVRTIAASTENDGVHGWTFPAGLIPATNYWVRIRTTDGLAKGSSGKFSLVYR